MEKVYKDRSCKNKGSQEEKKNKHFHSSYVSVFVNVGIMQEGTGFIEKSLFSVSFYLVEHSLG